jgi:hypothetical protein
MRVFCDYCGNEAACVRGADIYASPKPEVARKMFWHCRPCGAWVGCHGRGAWLFNAAGDKVISDGTYPLGRLAKAELRAAKRRAHEAFDPLWQESGASRRVAYAWLAHALHIAVVDCHIGLFDVARCEEVVRICADPNNKFHRIFPRKAA